MTFRQNLATLFAPLMAALLVVMLAACAGTGQSIGSAAPTAAILADAAGVPAPASLANRSIRDEQALLALELAYKLARTAGEIGLDAGLIKGRRASDLAALDNRAYLSVTLARSLYSAGNDATWRDALAEANHAVSAILPLLKGESP